MKFTVYGEPQGKARPRFTKSGRAYTPKKTVDMERRIALAYKSSHGELLGDDYIAITIRAYYPIPKSITKKEHDLIVRGLSLPSKKPDADNVLKLVMDGLNGVAYKDDKQVVYASVQKMYSDTPRTDVYIDSWKKGEFRL